MIFGLQAHELPKARERLRPFLENFAARSHGRVSESELARRVAEREAQVWIAGDWQAVCLTDVGPQHVNMGFCAGEVREDWQDDLEAVVSAWAADMGKRYVFLTGRPGWSRWARGKGYMPAHVEMVKELGNGR